MTSKPYSTSKVLAIEGLFGVGKSTLTSHMVHHSEGSAMVIPEDFNAKFLQLFYDNPEKQAFAFQWGMLKMRLYQKKAAAFHKIQVPPKLVLWDRSVLGDYVFALSNFLTGSISKAELDVYEDEFGSSWPSDVGTTKTMEEIDAIIYLYDSPSSVKNRVENVRKREAEKGIPYDYYNVVDLVHFNILLCIARGQSKPVVFLTPGDYGNGDVESSSVIYKRLLDESQTIEKYKARLSIMAQQDAFNYLTTIKSHCTNEWEFRTRVLVLDESPSYNAKSRGEDIIKNEYRTDDVDLPEYVFIQIPEIDETTSPFKVPLDGMVPYPEWFRALVTYYLSRPWSTEKQLYLVLVAK
uniref:Deoxyguanosine kinase mitochondrial n=1 Tax=Clandestinovirus TaxID=2831644 RepID=A0A8F8KNP2_9VIRU|nr:deoxyguanosine kinase mitochondrial precursor [Clandestinovirus]